MRHTLLTRIVAFVFAAALLAACATSKDSAQSDTAAAITPTTLGADSIAHAPAMSGVQNDAHGGMGDMSAMPTTTGNADHDFLRMMTDHHKGMVTMAHEAKEQKGSSIREIAARLDAEQDKELDQMTTMLERDFKDPYAPKVMPDNQKMIAALKTKTGAEFDRTFLENTIMHHQEAIKMVDGYLPKSANATIRTMAGKMKADQAREIVEFKQRLTKLKG